MPNIPTNTKIIIQAVAITGAFALGLKLLSVIEQAEGVSPGTTLMRALMIIDYALFALSSIGLVYLDWRLKRSEHNDTSQH